MYHDVVPDNDYDSSGFLGADADFYKLDVQDFKRQLSALAALPDASAGDFQALLDGAMPQSLPLMMTFDDGGSSAYPLTADLLERYGRRGFFFMATDFIDAPTFLKKEQLRALRDRGHIIGSHSCSHPLRMAACSWDQLVSEWSKSVATLSEILGEPVRVASVPGGQYSKKVAQAAASAGIKVLFTSEPTSACWKVDGCTLIGRYAVWQGMSEQTVFALASGRGLPRLKQYVFWNLKKTIKKLGGQLYLRARVSLRERSDSRNST
jgi:peptidoglycan/xylan/chitin deacetylase (PgdA/CDA1 family)